MPTAQTYWSDTITHAATGVTYQFAAPVEYGHYWNGDIFVVSNGGDITITQITPESDAGAYEIARNGTTGPRTVHGAMLQPAHADGNGFESLRTAGTGPVYNSAVNVDPGATGEALLIAHATYPTGASLVKAVSLLDMSQQADRSAIDKYSVLTVVPEVPPADAFRPPVMGTDKTSHYTLADLDFSALKTVAPVPGQQPISDFDYLREGSFVSWYQGSEESRSLHPNAYHVGYNDYQLDEVIVPALMALHSNYTDAEKLDLYAAIVQQGIDFAAFNNVAGEWLSETTHQQLFPPIIATAAVALDSQAIRDALLVPRGQTDFFYVPAELVGVENFSFTSSHTPSFIAYTADEVGKPDWRVTDADTNPSLSSAYRTINADTVPTIALLMDMLGDGEGRTVLATPAYFDYAERVRLIMEISPALGTGSSHKQTPVEAAFLAAYNAAYTNHSGMAFKPERPYGITATATGTTLSVSIDGEVFPGSSPVTQVDVRYKAGDGEWTVIQDFGMSGDITGLTAGQVYFVQARFVSALGEGPWSFNEFNQLNRDIDDILLAEGVITQAELDTLFGGSMTEYRKSSLYEDHLRDIADGDAGFGELTDDLVTGTAILPLSSPAPINDPTPAPEPQPDPIDYPAPANSLDFNNLPIEDFQPGRQDFGAHGISGGGATLTLDSQAWQAVLVDVAVTADTWLSFDFSATVEGEVHGVMFTNGNTLSESTGFNLFGTQRWGIEDYAYDGAGVQRIEIPVGQYFTGSFDRIVFFTDDDRKVGADSTFSNVVLSDGAVPPSAAEPQPEPPSDPEPEVDPAPEPEVDPAPEPDDEAQVMGVVQRVAGLDHTARTVAFRDGMELTDAMVFVTPPTFVGGDTASVVLAEVAATGVTMAIREPDYLDGWHMEEDLTMLALEAGSWTLADGSRLEVGSLTLDAGRTQRFASVTFEEAFDEAPAILVQLQTSNGADWAVLRTRNVTTTGFEVALQEQEASDGRHEAEIVGWAALDAAAVDGVVNWSGMTAQAFTAHRLADDTGGLMAFDAALGPDALIAAGISSFYGRDTATLRLRNTWAEGDRTMAEFLVQEEQSKDRETKHALEDISGVAFAQEGVLSALPTAADLMLVDTMSAYMDLG